MRYFDWNGFAMFAVGVAFGLVLGLRWASPQEPCPTVEHAQVISSSYDGTTKLYTCTFVHTYAKGTFSIRWKKGSKP